ncbi:MAG: ABC transporter ATP-binding protein [Verrucomicrobia bacterium]|nr:MAG: ABC transporter ATP-binding protein [Verrucomicrobiota bacterium]
MSSELAISVNNVSKAYTIWRDPAARLKHPLLNLAGELFPPLRKKIDTKLHGLCSEFYALNDISFEVKKGESVGIIGRNGSGKSTLLQIIAGTLQPTQGSVTVHGRVAALLELGSGFNPEFTGRENVYLNASILGLTREETDARFTKIAAFADIGDFINQPVKTYSSGMVVRLAFAVQSMVDPDVLIVDEALAVGDAKFQAQCFERLRQLQQRGTSILLVTHSSEDVIKHCSSAILLDHGEQRVVGASKHVVHCYMDLIFGKKEKTINTDTISSTLNCSEPIFRNACLLSQHEDVFSTRSGYNKYEYRWGDQAATILDYLLEVDGEHYPSLIESGKEIKLLASIKFNTLLNRPIIGINIKTKEGITVYGTNSELLNINDMVNVGPKESVLKMDICFIGRLTPGDYFISLGVATSNGSEIIPHDRRYDSIHFQITAKNPFLGLTDLDLKMAVETINQ